VLSREENELLVRTGPGTPMGEYLRRYWQPVLGASELPAPDCPPVRVGVLGERLVAFRDSEGQLGLLDELCPHRRASLFLGRNEECGLRCVYHGWKFDVDGQCVDMPNEPPEYEFKRRMRTRAYPVREWGGLVWAYLGPRETMPDLPQFEWTLVPKEHRFVSKRWQDSNYLQAVEGGIDSSHVSFLHSTIQRPGAGVAQTLGVQSYTWRDRAPRFSVGKTDYGLVIGARRDAEEDTYYWRITQFLLPTATIIPARHDGRAPLNGHFWVPIDDDNCWNFSVTWLPERPLSPEQIADLESGNSIHAGVDSATFRPFRNKDNGYLLDREAQRSFSFTGIQGVSEQDAAVQESMGRIVDRTLEHLGTSDTAVIAARRLLLREARDLAKGVEPHAATHPSVFRVRSGDMVLKRDVPFEGAIQEQMLALV
jgi:nitrite reductase/ring-hydroxylating ferredoxin subunit